MSARESGDALANWSVILDQLGPILRSTPPQTRIPSFLDAIRDQFHWPVAEYWVNHGGGYRVAFESHADLEELHRLARETRSIVVPSEWVRPERWRLDDSVPDALVKRVFWSAHESLSSVTIRGAMLAEAGLKTQVALPVPNQGLEQPIVMLFDQVSRRATTADVNALGAAIFLLAWSDGFAPEPEIVPPPVPGVKTRLDSDTRSLVGPLLAVRLTVYEWELLTALFERQGKAVAFQELSELVWGAPEALVGRAVIYDVVARLRRHLYLTGDEYRIASVPRYGYILETTLAGDF